MLVIDPMNGLEPSKEPKESLFDGYCFYGFTHFGKYPFAIFNLTCYVSYNLYMPYLVNIPV